MSGYRDRADDFIKKYTEEVFDQLFSNHYDEDIPEFTINDNTFSVSVYDNDNDIIHGIIMVNEYVNDGENCEQWEFSFNHSEYGEGAILEFCLHEDSKPKHMITPEIKEEKYVLIPANKNLEQENPQMWNVFLAWKKLDWFQTLEAAMNLDSYLAPCNETINAYKEKAAKHSLIFIKQAI
jgi:hypothetical protein